MKIFRKGFTLIELLVVIGILAVLMAGVVALIDPVDKTRQANDARMQSLVANAATAQESYAALNDGCYAQSWNALNTAGELKSTAPSLPNATYSLTITSSGNARCSAPEFDDTIICGTLQAKKYAGYTFWRYMASTGVTCAASACTAAGTCQP